MSWGTEFRVDVFISHMQFKSIEEVRYKIDGISKEIELIITQLAMYASSSNSIIPDEWKEEPIRWYQMQINELTTEYADLLRTSFQLQLYVEYLQEQHNN